MKTRLSIKTGLCALFACGIALQGANPLENGEDSGDIKAKLDEFVVSAAGYQQLLADAPASISLIQASDLSEMRINNIADALRSIEGIDVDATVGKTGTPTVSIRGLPSEYTLVLIDGRRQNVAGNIAPNGFNETAFAFLPPASAIDRIEVVRGPMSTLYGSDAMGGVVNIITRKVGDHWAGEIRTDLTLQQESEYGERYGSTLYVSGPLIAEKLGFTLRGGYIHRVASDIYATANNGTRFSINDANFVPSWQQSRGFNTTDADIWNLGSRIDWLVSKDHQFWLDLDWGRQIFDNSNEGLGTVDYGPTFPTVARGYKDELQFNRDQYALGWNGAFDLITVDTSLMYHSTETRGRTIPNNTFPGGSVIQAGDDRVLDNENIVFDTKMVIPFAERNYLTVGGQYWKSEMRDGIAADPTSGAIVKFKGDQWSVFAENAWNIIPQLTLTTGVRYNYHDVVGDNISPRAYLVWEPVKAWTFKGGVSQGFKTPGLNQFYNGINGVAGQGTIFSYGNPNLKPETSTSWELGTIFQNESGFTAGGTFFFTSFKDKIGSEPNPNVANTNWSVNVDSAESYGFESFMRYRFLEDWTLSANYTWTNSEYKSGADQGSPFVNTPEHVFNARLRWQTTDKLSLWVSGEYRGERYRGTDTRGIQAALGDYKAYQLYHLGGSYQASERLTFNATVYNLLDKDFVDFQEYDDLVVGAPRYASAYSNIHERRRLWLSANVTF
jgi:outer membrane receptor for ferrienterochelin and colicins